MQVDASWTGFDLQGEMLELERWSLGGVPFEIIRNTAVTSMDDEGLPIGEKLCCICKEIHKFSGARDDYVVVDGLGAKREGTTSKSWISYHCHKETDGLCLRHSPTMEIDFAVGGLHYQARQCCGSRAGPTSSHESLKAVKVVAVHGKGPSLLIGGEIFCTC